MGLGFQHSFRVKLQLVFVTLGLTAIAFTGWEGARAAASALEQATQERLIAIRQERVRRVEQYFADLSAHVLALAADESTVQALEEFAWSAPRIQAPEGGALLDRAYAGMPEAARAWRPTHDGVAAGMQHWFLAANPHPAEARDQLLRGPGAYGEIHARFHPTLHRYRLAFGFYDILLIGARDGRVLYSVLKEPDFGVRLTDPPYRDSPLAAIYQRAMTELSEPEQFVIADYEPYPPSHLALAAFAAAPVWRAGAKTGVLAIQVPEQSIHRLMSGDRDWRADGFGETGQAYITGPGGSLRSEPRRPVRTDASVLRSQAPLRIPGVDWTLTAEIERAEAFAPVTELRNRILGIGAAIAGVFFLAAAWLARSVTEPVRELARAVSRIGDRDFEVALPVRSRDEIGTLAEAFNRMTASLRETTVSKEELQALAGRLIHAQEDERRRLARELHDDLTQRLAVVAMEAGGLQRLPDGAAAEWRAGLERIKQHMARLSDGIHRLSRSLHPAILDDLGLAAALEAEARAFFERGGPPVDFECQGPVETLSRDAQLALFRIVQEALWNIQKHAAGASEVEVRLRHEDGVARLEVADNGPGFDRTAPGWRPGLGLASMEERVRLLDGRLEIVTAPDQGVRLRIRIPAPGAGFQGAS